MPDTVSGVGREDQRRERPRLTPQPGKLSKRGDGFSGSRAVKPNQQWTFHLA